MNIRPRLSNVSVGWDEVGVAHPSSAINRNRWRVVRRAVLERDQHRCRSCGCAGKLEVDHVIALADGGASYDLGNLQVLCRSCHISKTVAENRARRPVSPAVEAWHTLVRELLDR